MAIVVFVGTEEELKAGKGRLGLTTSQAAARLMIGERTFRKLIANGEITPYEEQLGQVSFFEESDVETLRQSRTKRF